ncbi:MAG: hypothetical protein IPJ15_04320 [Actinomycetales bacterium]|nr:hypothetical protein [Candidatus Phosphoribacter baldrii]
MIGRWAFFAAAAVSPSDVSSVDTAAGRAISIVQSQLPLFPLTKSAGSGLDHSPSSGPTTKSVPVRFLKTARTAYTLV